MNCLRFLTPVLLTMAWMSPLEMEAVERDFIFRHVGPIIDADPAVREEREVMAPAGFQTARTADELAICETSGPLKPIKITVGYKMVLGTSTKLYIYPEGTERPAKPRSQGWGSGTPEKVSDSACFIRSEPFGFLTRGTPYVVELEITIFETDIPPQHLWMPQSGKYQVLWHTTFRQTPKVDREFPPAIQAIKARTDRIQAQPLPGVALREWDHIPATETFPSRPNPKNGNGEARRA